MHKMWNTISGIIHKQKNNNISIKKICVQGKCIYDQTEIANIFNDFFMKIGPNLTKNIIEKDKSHTSYKKYNSILSSFNFQLIKDDALKKTYTRFVLKRHRASTVSQHSCQGFYHQL